MALEPALASPGQATMRVASGAATQGAVDLIVTGHARCSGPGTVETGERVCNRLDGQGIVVAPGLFWRLAAVAVDR